MKFKKGEEENQLKTAAFKKKKKSPSWNDFPTIRSKKHWIVFLSRGRLQSPGDHKHLWTNINIAPLPRSHNFQLCATPSIVSVHI